MFISDVYLFFQTVESAKLAFATMAGSGNLHFACVISRNRENKTAEKIAGHMFFGYVQGHMQKFSSFRGKKNQKAPWGVSCCNFPACSASSSDHPYDVTSPLSKHIPKTEDPNTERETFISL